MSTPDDCPLPDPYWAFYWPGGQAITKCLPKLPKYKCAFRYIADRGSKFKNSVMLDFGTGCGSASIAASQAGATVIANDIDQSRIPHLNNN